LKILVLNSGSSSLKYEVYQMPEKVSLIKGLIERIGIKGTGIITQKKIVNDRAVKYEFIQDISNHKIALELVLKALTDSKYGVLEDINEIDAIGHRVVHGGEHYSKSVIIDQEVLNELEECIKLAPLHNPANIIGIRTAEALLKDKIQVAVFDTAFHQTMPDYAYLYPIDYSLYEKNKIRKYGFHGTSHKYVYNASLEYLNITDMKPNAIILHLGNGGSLCAIKEGKSIDTTMGFTPLDGIVMGTRSGSIDPAIVLYLIEELGYSSQEVNNILNKKSGLLGISGISNDMRDLNEQKEVNKQARLAIDIYVYSIKKFLCSYIGILGDVEFITFTAGVGENAYFIREIICYNLENFGIIFDKEENIRVKRDIPALLSKSESKIKILAIPTNEELQIAQDTYDLKISR